MWRRPDTWSGRKRLEGGSGDGSVISAYPIRTYGPNNPGYGASSPVPRPPIRRTRSRSAGMSAKRILSLARDSSYRSDRVKDAGGGARLITEWLESDSGCLLVGPGRRSVARRNGAFEAYEVG